MLNAYFDESGQRGTGALASPTFLMGGIVVRDKNARRISPLLKRMRTDIGKGEDDELHFNKVRTHPKRVHLAKSLGSEVWLKGLCVVACKEHLLRGDLDDDQVYLYQLRMLLERLSWLARQHEEIAAYTLAHVRNFKAEKLAEYEDRLRGSETRIAWEHLDPGGGKINQPKRVEELQLADVFISSAAAAFNPDDYGNTEDRYLRELRHIIYRHSPASKITSYGLKMHPWNPATQLKYAWLTDW